MNRINFQAFLLVFLMSCASSSVSTGPGSDDDGGDDGGDQTQPFGLEERQDPNLNLPIQIPLPVSDVELVQVFSSLSFTFPVFLTHAPDGSDRIFVLELGGVIRVFDNDDNVTTSSVFLDIQGRVSRDHNEEGLLGLAFDPDYSTNGYFYVYYSAASPRRSVISRFTVTTDPNDADETSESILLEFPQPSGNHNGGTLAFGPDGMLYIATGDGGGAGDPNERALDRTNYLGNILRIDPQGTSYDIPSDNPFVGEGNGVLGEIFAYGLRNPYRFSFDRSTGDLWAGDVGQASWEEIDVIESGDNMGWPHYEGTHLHGSFDPRIPYSNTKPPVHEYGHNSTGGRSITGGYVYRGSNIPGLIGRYVYGDYASGRIWALEYDGTDLVSNQEIENQSNLVSFGEDQSGELYVVSIGGSIYRFEEASPSEIPTADMPSLLSETGIFSDLESLEPSPGVIPYDVNMPLWSDGAEKKRWMAVPLNKNVIFSEDGAWTFPEGSVLIKHFELPLGDGSVQRLETRVMVHHNIGWEGYTYKWRADESDADLLPDGPLDEAVGDQTWSYPSRSECKSCHTTRGGDPKERVLGLRTKQLNGDLDYTNATDNQLRTLNHIGLFSSQIGTSSDYASFPSGLMDSGATLQERSRAYLDSNCAHCHSGITGTAPGGLDLEYSLSNEDMNAINVEPTEGLLGLTDEQRIKPGMKESSNLWERMRRSDSSRMPRVGTNLTDNEAVDIIGQWIDSLQP